MNIHLTPSVHTATVKRNCPETRDAVPGHLSAPALVLAVSDYICVPVHMHITLSNW
jgi:hypothetical protein